MRALSAFKGVGNAIALLVWSASCGWLRTPGRQLLIVQLQQAAAMSSPNVWLGLAGDLADPDLPPEHYSTRIGGSPVFPGEVPPSFPPSRASSSSSKPQCQVCGRCLSLVLQVCTDRHHQLHGLFFCIKQPHYYCSFCAGTPKNMTSVSQQLSFCHT